MSSSSAAPPREPIRPPDAVLLESGPLALELWPSVGGSIAAFSWQHAGRRIELMRRATPRGLPERDGRERASFPLFPFSNRVKDGRFSFQGRDVELVRNTPPDHPIHGHTWQRPWTLLAAGATTAELSCRYPGADWPWAYTARQRFCLSPRGLAVELELVNDSDSPMPCGFGMHPYYDRSEGVRLQARAPVRWVGSQYLLPEWSEPVPAAWSFDEPQSPCGGCRNAARIAEAAGAALGRDARSSQPQEAGKPGREEGKGESACVASSRRACRRGRAWRARCRR